MPKTTQINNTQHTQRRIEVKFCVERGRRRLTCHERLQGYEKTHTYTYGALDISLCVKGGRGLVWVVGWGKRLIRLLYFPPLSLCLTTTTIITMCTHTPHDTEEDAHGVWVTDVVSVKPPPSSALSCLTRRASFLVFVLFYLFCGEDDATVLIGMTD